MLGLFREYNMVYEKPETLSGLKYNKQIRLISVVDFPPKPTYICLTFMHTDIENILFCYTRL